MLKPLTNLLPVVNQDRGMLKKPSQCRLLCPYYSVGEGFIEDRLPETAKILLMVSTPSADDLYNRFPLSGKAGWSFHKNYIEPLGYTTEDYGTAALIRCRPRGGVIPIGKDKKGTIQACRYYDRGVIKEFGPKSYIITQALKDIYKENSFHSLLVADLKKAFRFAEKGLRPILLMGQEVAETVAPYIIGQGGVKKFRGHWLEIDQWPFLSSENNKEPKPTGFTPGTYR